MIQVPHGNVHNEPFNVDASIGSVCWLRSFFREDNSTSGRGTKRKIQVELEQQLCHVILQCEKEAVGLETKKHKHRPRLKERV